MIQPPPAARRALLAACALAIAACSERPDLVSPNARPNVPAAARADITGASGGNIPSLGGTGVTAAAINNAGQIVGYSYVAPNQTIYHAFLWSTGNAPRDLGTLGGSTSQAVAVNDAGQVVGTSYVTNDATYHAFYWDATSGMHDIGTFGGTRSTAAAINASGQVVGYAYGTNDQSIRAFRWSVTTGLENLGVIGGVSSRATAINAHGDVVGVTSMGGSEPDHAFVWTPGGGMQDIGSTGHQSAAVGINSSGMVAANSDAGAFVWTPTGGVQQLPALNGFACEAKGINDAGQVFGNCGLTPHPFIWTASGGMHSLGTLGGAYATAQAMNSLGQIVGSSRTTDGASHAFLWTASDGMEDAFPSTGLATAIGVNDNLQVFYNASTYTISFSPRQQDVTPPMVTANITGTVGAHGWYTSDVSLTWSVSDDESPFTIDGCAPASVTTDGTAGPFDCTARSAGGTTSRSVTIKRDKTAPTISFSGNAGTYAVDQTIHIACTASDATSGIDVATCPNIDRAASTFIIGANEIDASARDVAGNEATASTTFTVTADAGSVCNLAKQFVSNAGNANSLCVKLQHRSYEAFRNELAALVGKKISAANAAVLSRLVEGLQG